MPRKKPVVAVDPPPITPEHMSTGYARPLAAWAASIGLPFETLEALRRRGKGPVFFLIGRRIYCREADWNRWLDHVAAGKIDATLHKAKRRHSGLAQTLERDRLAASP